VNRLKIRKIIYMGLFPESMKREECLTVLFFSVILFILVIPYLLYYGLDDLILKELLRCGVRREIHCII